MNYQPIAICLPPLTATLLRRDVVEALSLQLADPASAALTDFQRVIPATTPDSARIDDALNKMIRTGVRSLLVLRGVTVVGLITSYDIQGEKPILSQQGACMDEHTPHAEVKVSDVMTPWPQVPQLHVDALSQRRIGDVVETFDRHPDWLHLLVVDNTVEGALGVRGIFSRREIERRLRPTDARPP